MKEDRYKFPLDEWDAVGGGNALILTRKKPKVKDREKTPVKVEYTGEKVATAIRGWQSSSAFYIVQFRVTGKLPPFKNTNILFVEGVGNCEQVSLVPGCPRTRYIEAYGDDPPSIYIGSDARDKWSTPVLLPESIYSRLDEITKALEEKANGGKG